MVRVIPLGLATSVQTRYTLSLPTHLDTPSVSPPQSAETAW